MPRFDPKIRVNAQAQFDPRANPVNIEDLLFGASMNMQPPFQGDMVEPNLPQLLASAAQTNGGQDLMGRTLSSIALARADGLGQLRDRDYLNLAKSVEDLGPVTSERARNIGPIEPQLQRFFGAQDNAINSVSDPLSRAGILDPYQVGPEGVDEMGGLLAQDPELQRLLRTYMALQSLTPLMGIGMRQEGPAGALMSGLNHLNKSGAPRAMMLQDLDSTLQAGRYLRAGLDRSGTKELGLREDQEMLENLMFGPAPPGPWDSLRR